VETPKDWLRTLKNGRRLEVNFGRAEKLGKARRTVHLYIYLLFFLKKKNHLKSYCNKKKKPKSQKRRNNNFQIKGGISSNQIESITWHTTSLARP